MSGRSSNRQCKVCKIIGNNSGRISNLKKNTACTKLNLKYGSKETIEIGDDVCIDCRLEANRFYKEYFNNPSFEDSLRDGENFMEFTSNIPENLGFYTINLICRIFLFTKIKIIADTMVEEAY